MHDDHALLLHEKLELIKGIERMQEERRGRLRRILQFRQNDHDLAYFVLKKEIKLIRSQAERLEHLRQSVNN